MSALDDPGAVRAADPLGMLAAVLAMGSHARAGYAAGIGAEGVPSGEGVTAIAFCGMGGSGVAGDVVAALYRDRLPIPIEVVKGPALPEFCGAHTIVVCSSYSGDTGETVACFEEAVRRGCRIVAIASGGALERRSREEGAAVVPVPPTFPRPRSALGFLAFAALGALEAAGVVPSVEAELAETEEVLSALAQEVAPERAAEENLAKELAAWIGDDVPVMWGDDGISGVAAIRWRTELCENAKVPAFAARLPELNHNEIVGWSKGRGDGFALLALRHEGEHPYVARSFPVSVEIAADSGIRHREVWAKGEGGAARLLSLAMLGGATSVYLAIRRGFDPAPIEAIDRLKENLKQVEPQG